MKKLYLSAAVLLSLASSMYAQQPAPTPPDDQVVRISTDLIQVDVTVTDKDGKVVTGLGMGDFEIFENGQKQNISSGLTNLYRFSSEFYQTEDLWS